MYIDTSRLMSVTEVNQNFSRATKVADTKGSVVILKNNKPKYVLVNLNENPYIDLTEDEKIDVIAKRILEKHKHAFEVLSK